MNSLYWFTEMPSTMATPFAPGETTSIRRMYLEAVFGLFQNALCMMVAVESPASARETAPPDLKECIENPVCSPAFLACHLRICDICFADNGCDPRIGRPPAALGGDTVGNKYPFSSHSIRRVHQLVQTSRLLLLGTRRRVPRSSGLSTGGPIRHGAF